MEDLIAPEDEDRRAAARKRGLEHAACLPRERAGDEVAVLPHRHDRAAVETADRPLQVEAARDVACARVHAAGDDGHRHAPAHQLGDRPPVALVNRAAPVEQGPVEVGGQHLEARGGGCHDGPEYTTNAPRGATGLARVRPAAYDRRTGEGYYLEHAWRIRE